MTKADWEDFANVRFARYLGTRPVRNELLEESRGFKLPKEISV